MKKVTMKRWTFGLTVIMLLSAVLTGCGGGAKMETTSADVMAEYEAPAEMYEEPMESELIYGVETEAAAEEADDMNDMFDGMAADEAECVGAPREESFEEFNTEEYNAEKETGFAKVSQKEIVR